MDMTNSAPGTRRTGDTMERQLADFEARARSWVGKVGLMLPTDDEQMELTELILTGLETVLDPTPAEKQARILALLLPVVDLLELQRNDLSPDTFLLRELRAIIVKVEGIADRDL